MFRRPLVVHLLLLLLTMVWGATFVAVKTLVSELPAIPATVLRFAIAGVVLLALVPLLPAPQVRRGDGPRLALVGLLGVPAYHLALNSGASYLPAGVASLVIATNPIFTALLAGVFLGERPTPGRLAGIGLAFAGLAMVVLLGGQGATAAGRISLLGVGLVMLAPLSWAVSTIISKPMLGRYNPISLTTYTTLLGTLYLLPLTPTLGGQLWRLSAQAWASVLYLALMGTVIGYFIWFNGLRSLSATGTTVYTNLIPCFGLFWAWLLLGERISVFVLLGGILIIGGVLLTNLSAARPGQPAPRRAHEQEEVGI